MNALALHPEQPRAERRDQRVADDLDIADGLAHHFRGGAEQGRRDPDDQHRDQRLQKSRRERQDDAAPPGFFIGDEIGRDHRLAVAGTGGVENSVREGEAEQRQERGAVGFRARGWRRTWRDNIPPVCASSQPVNPSGGGAPASRAAECRADRFARAHRSRTPEAISTQIAPAPMASASAARFFRDI